MSVILSVLVKIYVQTKANERTEIRKLCVYL